MPRAEYSSHCTNDIISVVILNRSEFKLLKRSHDITFGDEDGITRNVKSFVTCQLTQNDSSEKVFIPIAKSVEPCVRVHSGSEKKYALLLKELQRKSYNYLIALRDLVCLALL